MKITIFTFTSVQFCGIKATHTVVQLSPLLIHELFPFCKIKTLYPLNNSPYLLISAPGNHHSTFCLYKFDYSRYLIQVELQVFVFLCIHVVARVGIFFLLKTTLHGTYLSHFVYPFVHQWTTGLFPSFGYYE